MVEEGLELLITQKEVLYVCPRDTDFLATLSEADNGNIS